MWHVWLLLRHDLGKQWVSSTYEVLVNVERLGRRAEGQPTTTTKSSCLIGTRLVPIGPRRHRETEERPRACLAGRERLRHSAQQAQYSCSVYSPFQFLAISPAMLPRHLRPAIITSSAPAQIRALLYARNSLRPAASALQAHRVALHPSTASFHSSSRRQNEAPRSPFQIFVEVLRDEIRKNRELQDNVKQLQGDVDKLQDSEAMRKARAAYERARVR